MGAMLRCTEAGAVVWFAVIEGAVNNVVCRLSRQAFKESGRWTLSFMAFKITEDLPRGSFCA